MKKKIAAVLFALTLFANSTYAQDINIICNQNPVIFSDGSPYISDGRIMVPIKGLFENLGFKIIWNNELKEATLSSDYIVLYISQGKIEGLDINDNPIEIAADVLPQIRNSRLYIPMRAITECVPGTELKWNENTKTAEITQTSAPGMGMGEEAYIRKIIQNINAIKEWARTNDDSCLMYFYGKEGSVYSDGRDYSPVKKIINDTAALPAPSGMEKIKGYLDDYLQVISSLITSAEQNDLGITTNGELTADLNNFKQAKENVSIMFGVALNDYFKENNVDYEKIFGEYTLDVMK